VIALRFGNAAAAVMRFARQAIFMRKPTGDWRVRGWRMPVAMALPSH